MANFKDDIKNQEKMSKKNIFNSDELQDQFSDSDSENLQENSAEYDEEIGVMNGYDDEAEDKENPQENNEEEPKEEDKKKEKTEEKDSGSSEHDGKYFVIQKGKCQCNQGFQFPSFKVTSHQKHYWNDEEGQADYLAVTEDDLTLNPPAMPFGNCKLKPSSGGYLPCTFAPAGKWAKTYDKVKVMGKSCVTEISELMCATGGKITILKHGQQSEIGKSNVSSADSQEQNVYNPIMDFEEFKEGIEGDYSADYE